MKYLLLDITQLTINQLFFSRGTSCLWISVFNIHDFQNPNMVISDLRNSITKNKCLYLSVDFLFLKFTFKNKQICFL